jgi:nickel transport protein
MQKAISEKQWNVKKVSPVILGLMLSLVLIFRGGNVSAHGTEGGIGEGKGILVRAVYDDGDAMSYTETHVFHEPDTMPFQAGRTDKNGCFLFKPDGPGTWRVEVKDEMGHAMILKTEVKEVGEGKTDTHGSTVSNELRKQDKFGRALAGVGLIALVTGGLFWMSARRKAGESGVLKD